MKNKIRLGVNIDHVATLRNVRGENYPSPLQAAQIAEKNGADLITVHLREDRRHIQYKDVFLLKKYLKIPINLEMALTKPMINIALKLKPNFVCIVPEKRKEVTTEGGLNLNYKKDFLKESIELLQKKKKKVSLFIEPNTKSVKAASELKANNIEIHTGKFAKNYKKKLNNLEFNKIKSAAILAKTLGLGVHAGHGLTYESAKKITQIKEIVEFNIGHFIVSESVFFGIASVLKKFKKILNS